MDGLPTHDLTDRELKFSYWYVTHKISLRRYLTLFLIALSAILFFYVAWQMIFYVIDYQPEAQMIQRLAFNADPGLVNLSSGAPQPFAIGSVVVLASEGSRPDYLAPISNPNANWLATFDYQFVSGDKKSGLKHGFVLPGEQKYLLGLGIEGQGAQLEIANLAWQKVSDFAETKNTMYQFEVSDEDLVAGQAAGDPNKVIFKIKNKTAFNYWQIGLQVFLYSSGDLVAANYLSLDQLKSFETREVEMNWNERLPRVDEIQVVPELNFYDRQNIMKPDSN